ncbi:MAG TPA: twin-arginine translocase subunit TatC [Bacteroidales bacterium]|nr:twin-arginine translocase subunit TatC [Bacteroidales bacterium]
MTFMGHLEELRWVLVRSAASICIAACAAFIGYKYVFDYILLGPKSPDFFTNRFMCYLSKVLDSPSFCINSKPLKLINIDMAGQFNTHVQVSIYAGLILAFPYIIYQLWKFISPALYDEERNKARGAVLIISGLFIIGVLFGYYFITPFSVDFLSSYSISTQIENTINLSSYISLVSSLSLVSGLVFEMPVLVFFLTKIGIITPDFLKKYRRHAFIVILIIAAIISPPDILSMTLISIPLWVLFEVSIIVSKRIIKKKATDV